MIKINGKLIEQNNFPDNTLLTRFDISPEYDNVFSWKYENDAELFTLYCLKRHIDNNYDSHSNILILNYIPNARMDRVKENSDVFTLKYFCEIINNMNFDSVEVFDPHSPVSEALINKIYSKDIKNIIDDIISKIKKENNNDDMIIFYPDNGAYKKYTSYIKQNSCYGIKNRDWKTGKILGLDIITNGINIKGKDVLIVDDICSKGGSAYYSCKKLKELGCGKIYIYFSHCENSILEGDLINSELFEKIYTTNTLFSKEHEKIKVIDIDWNFLDIQ